MTLDEAITAGAQHRAELDDKEDAAVMRKLFEDYLGTIYDPLPEPIDKAKGDYYAELVKNYLDWAKDVPAPAIPTDPVFLAQFLHGRRMAGDDEDLIGAYADAIARANNVIGWADPTGYQLTLSVICNNQKRKN
jgi:hypothetical protein